MSDNTYNGYIGNGSKESAYSTWNVALWIDNDFGLYSDKVQECQDRETWTAADVEEFVTMYFHEGTPDMQGEDGYGSLELVNWDELAECWTDEIADLVN